MEHIPRYVFWGFVILIGAALTAIWFISRPAPPPEAPLHGAGSTFVYPLMVQWSSAYEKKDGGCKIEYDSVGSGSGIKQIIGNKVDFACTDGPLTDGQLAKAREAGGEVVHIPLVLGAVVPAYNLAEVSGPLRFSGPVLADIYLGKITMWSDKAIKDLNPTYADRLPNKEIVVVHRSDGSGTTYIWTDYLSKVSEEWKKQFGVGLEVKWPTGVAEEGNEGVSERVKNTPASIGYVELTYAFRKDISFGLVRNREGEFVKAGVDSVKAAGNALVDVPDDLRYSLTDAPGKGSYPISGTTWAVVHVTQSGNKARQLFDFLFWVLDEGQEHVGLLLYVPLPDSLRERGHKQIRRIQGRN